VPSWRCHRAFDPVRTRLRHGVDQAAGEVAVTDVERCACRHTVGSNYPACDGSAGDALPCERSRGADDCRSKTHHARRIRPDCPPCYACPGGLPATADILDAGTVGFAHGALGRELGSGICGAIRAHASCPAEAVVSQPLTRARIAVGLRRRHQGVAMAPTVRRFMIGLCGFLAAACKAPARPAQPAAPPPTAVQQPEVKAPADVSHGEAPVAPTATPAPIDPDAPPLRRERLRHVRLEISDANVTIAPGVTYYAWTFGGTIPGPFLRVTQGDTVDFTLVNKAPQPHSMDFHAAEIAPNRYYVNINAGDSLHYRFVARVPGAFMYHCGTAPVAMHIANGMYGALIVDPATHDPAPGSSSWCRASCT